MNLKDSSGDIIETNPHISVIMPVYNRESLVSKSITSVIDQTYTNWELIIVDDGSTDGTIDAIKKIDDKRIRLIQINHCGHINHVMNTGVKNCTGNWLAFLDSDDLWLPEKLESQLIILKKEKTKWIYSNYEFIDENENKIHRQNFKFIPFSGQILNELIMTKTSVTICSIMIEKKFFNEIGGFSERNDIRGDYEFTLRAALHTPVSVVPNTLVQVREHSGRVTKSRTYPHERTARTYQAFIKQKPGKEFEKLARKRLAQLLSEASVYRFRNKNYGKAISQLIQSLWLGDDIRHWLSAIKKGLNAIFKKHTPSSAKKGKEKNVAAYHT